VDIQLFNTNNHKTSSNSFKGDAACFNLTEEQIKNIAASRALFVVELRVSAILAIHNSELVVLQIKHFG